MLYEEGWWRRNIRLVYPAVQPHNAFNCDCNRHSNVIPHGPRRTLLIVGATGTLGQAFERLCHVRGLQCTLSRRRERAIGNDQSVAAYLTALQPWAGINCAGYVRVDEAEKEVQRCYRENAFGPAILARHCQRAGIALV